MIRKAQPMSAISLKGLSKNFFSIVLLYHKHPYKKIKKELLKKRAGAERA
jgi:hypothetical protein